MSSVRYDNAPGESSEAILNSSKQLAELLQKIQENIARASNKNESLLEAIESSEAKASLSGSNEVPLLRNIRARLAAAHTPNSALRRDLAFFSGILEGRINKLETSIKDNSALRKQLKHDNHDLEVRIKSYEQERMKFEEEKAEWKEILEQEKQEVIEQNDRLAVLSESLSGAKYNLDARKNELASQRIAFEEEKLVRLGGGAEGAVESEAEALRIKLKEQVIRNVELENVLLHTELSLHQKEESVSELEQKNSRLQIEMSHKRTASSRAVKQFETKMAESNKKLSQMNSELLKSQEHARRFQDLLTSERRKQKSLKHALEQEIQRKSIGSGGDSLTLAGQKAYVETLAQTLSVSTKGHGPVKAEDVARKSEVVQMENAYLKAEIRKLRIENHELLRKVRFADTNAHYMRNQVVANIADRAELMKKLEKAEAQHHELEQSITKQASEWVSLKRREAKIDKSNKWSQIQPIPVLGARERTWSSPTLKGHLSRSIPVQKW